MRSADRRASTHRTEVAQDENSSIRPFREWKSNLPGRGEIFEFHISTLDEPEAFVPTSHFFYPERIAWFDLADDLPRYHGFDFDSDLCRQGPLDDDPLTETIGARQSQHRGTT